MKGFKRAFAIALILVLVFSCTGNAIASGSTTADERGETSEKVGFRSDTFRSENVYQYSNSETVRAIVILDSEPIVDVTSNDLRGRVNALDYKLALQEERTTIKSAIEDKNVIMDVVYEYDTLLNGFSCDVAYGDLDTIADMNGVQAVYIANVYSVPTTMESSASEETTLVGNGINTANSYGAIGEGEVIAVLDTGVNLKHEAFEVYEDVLGDTALVRSDITSANLGYGTYVSEKVPYAYDYADHDNDVTDNHGHGSHVSGIAVGYAEDSDGAVTFQGAAPAAQLLAMKIFSSSGNCTTSSDIYFAALEDAYNLGADVINLSIGASSGFTYDSSLEEDVYGNIYKKLQDAGVVVCCAGGNEYSMAEYSTSGYITPEYTDYGNISSPASYIGNIAVASMENVSSYGYMLGVGNEYISYIDNCDEDVHSWMNTFGGDTTDYVIIKNSAGEISAGTVNDFAREENNVKGKIAVVQRGSINFKDKVKNAAAAGAIGCIVVNNEAGQIGMSIDEYAIPAVIVPKSALDVILENSAVTTYITPFSIGDTEGGRMSDFSNWGPSPDLTISPVITAAGGYIYSVDSKSKYNYVVMSGTSMASANMAGIFANVLSYLRGTAGLSKTDAAETARALLESTADYVYDDSSNLYSVRKQGSGLGMTQDAIDAYMTGAYVDNPIAELGDSESGEFVINVTLKNESNDTITYTPNTIVMTDALSVSNGITYNTMNTETLGTEYVSISMLTRVTVPAGESTAVTVTLSLTDAGKAHLAEFTNGAYIEGYLEFTSSGKQDVHTTFLGYYGDWTKASVLEQYDFRDYIEIDYKLNTDDDNAFLGRNYTPEDFMDGIVTSYNLAALGNSYGKLNVLLGDNYMDYVEFNEKHMTMSNSASDADYLYGSTLWMEPYQLRNAKNLILTITDAETGEVYYKDDTQYLTKAYYQSDWISEGIYSFKGTDAKGTPLEDGTVIHIQYDAILPYNNAVQSDCWSFDVTIDNKTPTIESYRVDAKNSTITVTATDNHYLASIYLVDASNMILMQESFSDDDAGEEHVVQFDTSDLRTDKVYVCAMDYATNETDSELIDLSVSTEPDETDSEGEDVTSEEENTASDNNITAADEEQEEAPIISADPIDSPTPTEPEPEETDPEPTTSEPPTDSEPDTTQTDSGQDTTPTPTTPVTPSEPSTPSTTSTPSVPDTSSTTSTVSELTQSSEEQDDGDNIAEDDSDSKAVVSHVEVDYSDVQESQWYYEAVDYVTGKGIMNGVGDGKFEPNSELTRAMLVTILYRLDGEPKTKSGSFSDVESGKYYTDAVSWAAANGIVSGYGGGLFGPNDKITRQQMAVILYNYAAYKNYDETETKSLRAYSDASSVASWADTAMKWAVGTELINGIDGALDPTGNATRAQVAKILMGFCLQYVD